MTDIIDFVFERAKRKSGIADLAVLKDMIDSNYDPCDPDEVTAYWVNKNLLDGISTDPITFTVDQEYIYIPDFSLFFDDTK